MSLLRIRNLSVDFATASGKFRAVDSVDQDVDTGEILAIVGESGSGKSVSMLALMGLLPWTATVTADELTFDGHDLLKMDKRARRKIVGNDLAMIFQEPMPSLNPAYTIGDQLAEALLLHRKVSRQQARDRAIELLEKVGITAAESRLSQYPHQLSGGLRQRVMIAMALMCEPELIIADEPTTALDVTIQAQILRLLHDLGREMNMAVILITHDLGVVARVADKVAVMYAGELVETGPVADIFNAPSHPYTRGLLAAVPRVDDQDATMKAIPGNPPNMAAPPQGCPFRPRCTYAGEDCRVMPPLAPFAEGRARACHRPISEVTA